MKNVSYKNVVIGTLVLGLAAFSFSKVNLVHAREQAERLAQSGMIRPADYPEDNDYLDSKSMAKQRMMAPADPVAVFRSRYILKTAAQTGQTPQVFEVTFPQTIGSGIYLVDAAEGKVQPFVYKNVTEQVSFSVKKDGVGDRNLTDGNTYTGTDFFMLPEGNTYQYSEIEITLTKPTVLTGVRLKLSSNSDSPRTVTVKGIDSTIGQDQVVFVNQAAYQPVFDFPSQTISKLVITVGFNESIRLSEIELVEPVSPTSTQSVIRFLGKPQTDYVLYANKDPQQSITQHSSEAGNLFARSDFKAIQLPVAEANPYYQAADRDGDGLTDALDNCPVYANANQADANSNGIGDVCEDFDSDSVDNAVDNCPEDPNTNQRDSDGDSLGDKCDGQESRFTEQNPWLPWAAMGLTGVIIAGLFYSVLHSAKFSKKA
jgi:hypothetical protein